MSKLEKILLHVPILGLLLILVMMNDKTNTYDKVTYDETKAPFIIQLISIVLIPIGALLFI